MADYIASLDKLIAREDSLLLSGHGGPVTSPAPFLRALKTHRRLRERSIIERIRAGDSTIPRMVEVIYRDTDKRLHGAAALSVLAHIEDLMERGEVTADRPPSLVAHYRLAGG
jgi:glyoxylase-like metal-dependent hydrolase (beta-lactamase superfamily II)